MFEPWDFDIDAALVSIGKQEARLANSANAAKKLTGRHLPSANRLLKVANADSDETTAFECWPAIIPPAEPISLAGFSNPLADGDSQKKSDLAILAGLAEAQPEKDTSDLASWIACVRQATEQEEVFAVLDRFRPLPWTDEQRAAMSHAYMAQLHRLQAGGVEC